MKTRIPVIENLKFSDNSDSFLLIAGPCVVESEELVLTVADRLTGLSDKYRIPLIFKSSYRKANRSRGDSFTGIGYFYISNNKMIPLGKESPRIQIQFLPFT